MKPGEAKFRASIQRMSHRQRLAWLQPTPKQWTRLAIIILGIVAAKLGVDADLLRELIKALER